MELSVYDSTLIIKYSLIKTVKILLSDITSRKFFDSRQQVSITYNSSGNDKIIYLQYADIKQPHTVSFTDFKTWFDGNVMSSGGGGTQVNSEYIRKSDYVALTLTSYQGFAVTGSLESDAVWSITKTITTAAGAVTSSVRTNNVKWTERYLL